MRNRETALEKRERVEGIWSKMDDGDFSALEEFTKKGS